jgi:general secretion pathway protein D
MILHNAVGRSGLAALIVAVFLVACATEASYVAESRRLIAEGRGEEALVLLDKVSREDPDDHAARSEYFRQRSLLVAQWLSQAEILRQDGQFGLAESRYRLVLKYDAANPRARAGLDQLVADKRHAAILATAGKLVKAEKYLEAQDVLRPVLAEDPQNREAQRLQRRIDEKLVRPAIMSSKLKPAVTKPISLELRDVSLRNAFDVLSRATGVNFVFDKDVRLDQKASLVIKNATVEEAITLLLAANQLARNTVNENTLFVFPNTPAKVREHRELVVKSFYLANADVKQTASMIRTVVKTRDIFIDEKLNLLVIKDTPEAVRLAERLVAAQDLAEPEVVLEVEVLEVASSRLRDLGVQWPTQVQFQDPSTVGAGVVDTATSLQRLSGGLTAFVATPVVVLKLQQEDGTTSLLANPRIRVKNREKARIHIGDRVPVITTTAAATGGFVSESVSYLDVGLKLEVEPLIYLDDEIGIQVGLEVSNIVKEVRSLTSGTLAYQIGTRSANTKLRLHDGETQILAGLISDEDRRTASRVPGLGELPTVGRLFSSNKDTANKTEIVLLITPRLVRTLARPDVRSLEFAAGTESTTGASAARVAPVIRPSPAVRPPAPVPVPGSTMVPFGGMQPEPRQSQ